MKSREQKDAVSSTSAGPEFGADNHGAAVAETRARLSTALGWNGVGFASQAIFQLIFGLLLARILGPTTYGLVAMAWVALTPATILADAGLGLALVQKQELTSATIRYSFCVQSFLAFLVGIFLCILAPRLAEFFAAPELIEVLFVGSSILLVQAFGLTSVNLLRRQLDFRRLQIVQLVALIGSAVLVSLPLALAGFGIWSPVGGALANAAMTSIGAGVLTPTETGISASHHFGSRGRRRVRPGPAGFFWHGLLDNVGDDSNQWRVGGDGDLPCSAGKESAGILATG